MKKTIIKGLLYIALPAMVLGACKKVDITDGVKQYIDLTISESSVFVRFVDAVSGQQLDLQGIEDIQTRIEGINADLVADNFGGTNYGADYGMMGLSFIQGVTPSAQSPVAFTIHATANDYLPVSKEIIVTNQGNTTVTIKMISKTNTPDDVVLATDVITGLASDGTVANDFTFTPSTVSSTGTGASLFVPANTKFLDKNNQAVSGNVDVELTYVSPGSESASQNIPGTPIAMQLANEQSISYRNLGAINLDIMGSSKEVKNFDSPIEMTVSIPTGAVDNDGNTIAAGDQISIYSYDEENSYWNLESEVTVTQNNTTGLLEATCAMDHLSWWMFTTTANEHHYYFNIYEEAYVRLDYSSSCNSELEGSSQIYMGQNYYYTPTSQLVAVFSPEPTTYSFDENIDHYTISLNYAITAYDIEFYWYRAEDPSDKLSIYLTESDIASQSVNVPFPASWCPQTPPVDFDITLTTSCPSNPNNIYRPQCSVMAYKKGELFTGEMIQLGQMTNGILSTNTEKLTQGEEYHIMCMYMNKFIMLTGTAADFYTGTVLVDGETIDLSRPMTANECAYVKG